MLEATFSGLLEATFRGLLGASSLLLGAAVAAIRPFHRRLVARHESAVFCLLREGETSRWHRVDAAETWHHDAGAPLELRIADRGEAVAHMLGDDVAAGHRPQVVVPPDAWQSARRLGAWTLVGSAVTPAFALEHFELAPDGWQPREP